VVSVFYISAFALTLGENRGVCFFIDVHFVFSWIVMLIDSQALEIVLHVDFLEVDRKNLWNTHIPLFSPTSLYKMTAPC